MEDMWVWFLRRNDPLEKEMETHSSILAWKISWTEEPGVLHSTPVTKSWTWLGNYTTTTVTAEYVKYCCSACYQHSESVPSQGPSPLYHLSQQNESEFASNTNESLILWSQDGEKRAHILPHQPVGVATVQGSNWGKGGVGAIKGAWQMHCSCSRSSARLSLCAHGPLLPSWILSAVFWFSPEAEVSAWPFCTRNCGLTCWVRLLPMTPCEQVTAD